MVEQSMQVELTMRDESLQTSPREDHQKEPEQIVLASDVIPQVADKLVSDIVNTMPIRIPTETQNTITETVTTVEQVTQTTPRSEEPRDVQASHVEDTEPYEINIQTSFVIPDDTKTATESSSTPVVLEIQKSYVIDETQPGNVREIESTTKEKVKKSKSKKKKKKQNTDKRPDSDDEPIEIKQIPPTEVDKQIVQVEQQQQQHQPDQPEQKPTVVTINITKTTVYETSNLIGREARPHSSSVRIEEVLSDDNDEAPWTPGKIRVSP